MSEIDRERESKGAGELCKKERRHALAVAKGADGELGAVEGAG
jgi:hypothetical protein